MSLKTEVRDQALHFIIGFALTVALAVFMPVVIAGLAVMFVALIRELLQHPQKRWYQLGKGSQMDLSFWWLGSLLAQGLVLFEVIS